MTGHYMGPDRRKHRVLYTSNTEYHMRGTVCVAVKGADGVWLAEHAAIGSELIGVLLPNGGWDLQPKPLPDVGSRLCFSCDLMTSPMRGSRRPSRNTVSNYSVAA